MSLFLLIFLWCLCALAGRSNAFDQEMTVNVDAGTRQCFCHYVDVGSVIDIEYQVIDGGRGDLDINFDLSDPSKRLIVADFKKPDNLLRHEVKERGDYCFCFDNTISKFNRKTVFFELIIEGDGLDEIVDRKTYGELSPEEVYDIQVQDIQDSIHTVKTHLTKARQLQDMLRSFEARDRNLAEDNLRTVSNWSALFVLVMLMVGALQVLMLRGLFDTKSHVHRVWTWWS